MPFNYAYQKYLRAISQFSLLKNGDSVLVGFSGGADSTLLLTLVSMTEGISVAAAHLNHGIRGAEADRDEAFCKSYCEKLGIKLFTSYADIPSISKATSRSVEEAARDARYSFFNEVAENNGFSLIATAHNDNIWTIDDIAKILVRKCKFSWVIQFASIVISEVITIKVVK